MLILLVYMLLFEKTESLPLLQKFPRKFREWYNVESFCILRSDKFITVGILFHNFWSSRSIRLIQITTDCSVFDRFCFQCVVCLF